MSTTEIKEQELTIDFASYDEKSQKVVILAHADGESPASMNIQFQAYNEEKREFYDDEEAKAKGMEKLAKTGLTLDDIKKKAFIGKTFIAYTYEGRITFTKPQRYVRANQISNREAIQLDGLEIVSLPITEQSGKHRFRLMVETPIKVKGKDEPELLGFIVSQIIFDDPEDLDTAPRGIGLKYSNKEILEFEEQLKNSEGLPESVTDAIKNFLTGAVERARESKVTELKDRFNIDIEEAIEKGLRLKLKLHKQQIPNSEIFYLQADLLEIIEPEETEE
jgi:hypothetical protein